MSSLVAGVRSAAPALGEALGSAVGSALGPALGSTAADTAARVGEAVGGEVAGLGEEPSSTESGTELYEHHPRDLFPDWDHSRAEPRRVLAQHRRRTEVAWGTSLCARLHAGRRFVLENHPQAFLDGERVVVRVEHRGMARPLAESERSEATYRNSFECVPASVTYVPPRPRRRVVQNCLTATVVGPSGEDIHVNSKGEIRVRFHWDRDGGGADSSCWIRTMQTWGGPGWGTQFIPRVGMEVVVSFDEGDMDRPLVLGCLYNATHPPSFALPAQKTRSGIRTQSSPLREGYNELSFEDAAEREQVYLRAQRDFDSVVERDRTAKISRDDRTRVSGEQATEVQGTQSWRLHGDRTAELDKDDHLRVQGSRHVTILHDSHERVAGSRSVRVEARERTETVGDRTSLVHGELVHEVRGAATMLVGRHDAKRSCTLAVEGVTQLTGSEVVDLASDTELVLRCGKSFIRLSPGEIEISSPKVTMRGKDARLLLQGGKAKLKAKKLVQAVSDDKIVLTSSGASLGLGSEAKLDGAQVLLNSPERATDSIEANEPELTKIELVDQEGHPIPYQRFRVELDDGSRYVGFLDEHGKAEIDVEGSGEIVFPDLAEVEEG